MAWKYPDVFRKQTEWIVENVDERNIKFVIHLGDLVQHNENMTQWNTAKKSMSLLNEKIPYLISPGNHDVTINAETGIFDYSTLNEHFPLQEFEMEEWYGGNYPGESIQNNYGFFSDKDHNFLAMGLEFCPRDDVLDWANEILASNEEKEIILFTHQYLLSDKTRGDRKDLANCQTFNKCEDGKCNNGEGIWEKLVSKHENITLVLSAHLIRPSVALKTDCINGNLIHQTVQNYQDAEDEGWLRIYEFRPLDKRIDVKTYSPHLDRFDYSRSQNNNFSLMYLDSNCIV